MKQVAFFVEGHRVSNGSLIAFVRNKLGCGHFDLTDRKKWQKDLLKYSEFLEIGCHPILSYPVKSRLDFVLSAVDACGIDKQIELQVNEFDHFTLIKFKTSDL